MPLVVSLTLTAVAALALTIFGWHDANELGKAHARPAAYALNIFRSLAGLACVVGLEIWSGQQLIWIALVAIFVAMLFLPTGWMIAATGGREPKWELRHLMAKMGQLLDVPIHSQANPDDKAAEMRGLMHRVVRLRTPELSELCDLQLALCREWLADKESVLVSAARYLRMHDLERELYGDQARQALLDPDEATRRWRLYRTFGWLIDAGDLDMSADRRAWFGQLVDELDRYRSPEAGRFIDLVSASARSWLAEEPKTGPWLPEAGLAALGPAVDAEMKKLWPTAATFFGAELDELDAEYFSRPDIAAAVRQGAGD